MKLAILQMADTPQIESTAVMLRHAGYDVKVCGARLRKELQSAGLDTVLSVQSMVDLGYDALDSSIGEATVEDMSRCDLFVEIKVRNVPKVVKRWPNLASRILYWRVNGAQPEICPSGGDEVNLPCPIVTACLWYGSPRYYQVAPYTGGREEETKAAANHRQGDPITIDDLRREHASLTSGAHGVAYTFWPPYPRSVDYDHIDRRSNASYGPPFCIAHSARAWGYGEIMSKCVDMGVSVYGNNAPAGQIPHSQVPFIVGTGKALVHLKSVDCPGWALYEAMLAGCPVIVGRLLNSRMLAYSLLEHNVTCLEFGVPASLEYGRGDMQFDQCLYDIRAALNQLSDFRENQRIGEAGRARLNELMWRADRDGAGFVAFMQRWFP